LIVGLGNPGSRYQNNRHNVGFMVVDAMAREGGLTWKSHSRLDGEVATGQIARCPAVLLKPMTFMNLSGESVQPAAHFYRVEVERIIVVHDDIDLDLGRLKLKQGGGDGGHKGLRSMTQQLGSPKYVRIRCGVGRSERGGVVGHVLSNFRPEEREALEELTERASAAVCAVVTGSLKDAMNRFNAPPTPVN